MGLFRSLMKLLAPPRRSHRYHPPASSYDPASADEAAPMRHVPWDPPRQVEEPTGQQVLRGRCWVIDGDTVVIDQTHIRLAGIDAPEIDQPYGRNAKQALIALCRGQVVTAVTDGSSSYERAVATCRLEDGRDLSAEMVKAGLALDWRKHSGGRYRHLEVEGARKRLWRVDARQRGRMPPSARQDQPSSPSCSGRSRRS